MIVPTHNRLPALQQALDSVRRQTFTDYEVILVNDGSTDRTAEWARAVWAGSAGTSSALVEIPPPGAGAAAARNRGLEKAGGEIVAFLDDDDLWRPSYLQTQVAQLDAHPEAESGILAHLEFRSTGKTSLPVLLPAYPYPGFLVHLLAECPIHTLSVVACRRSAFERIGAFDESLSIVHDLDWYARLILAGGNFVHGSQLLVEHAVPGGLVTRYRNWFEEERKVHERYFEAAPVSVKDQAAIRAARGLFFFRTALAKDDLAFGLARLAEAFGSSPAAAAAMMARRLHRQMRPAQAGEAQ